jgi:hypothetical protein
LGFLLRFGYNGAGSGSASLRGNNSGAAVSCGLSAGKGALGAGVPGTWDKRLHVMTFSANGNRMRETIILMAMQDPEA